MKKKLDKAISQKAKTNLEIASSLFDSRYRKTENGSSKEEIEFHRSLSDKDTMRKVANEYKRKAQSILDLARKEEVLAV
jgi:hypothetical protein